MPRKRGPDAAPRGEDLPEDRRTILMYMDLVAEVPIGISVLRVKDPDDLKTWRIVEMNPAALRLSAATDADARRALVDFESGVEETELPRAVREVLKTGEARVLSEYSSRRVPGVLFALKVFSLGGRFVGMAFEDISAQKAALEALARSEEQLRLTIDSVSDYAIFRIDSCGRIASWNRGAQRITGYAVEDILGLDYDVFFEEEDARAGRPRALLERARRDGRSEDEGWRRRKDGGRFRCHSILTAIRKEDGSLRGFVKVTRDVTEQCRVRQALEDRTADLARSNADLARFASMASHDLQAPLRKAAAFSEEIRDRIGGRLDAAGRDLLTRLLRALEGMQELVDGLLSLARISTGKAEFVRVDLARLAAEAREDLEPALSRDGGVVEIGALPAVDADPRLMRQLLRNLIGNAVKFRRPGVPPRVRVSGQTRADGGCELVVVDEGVGFDMKEAGRLFEPFQRLHGLGEFPGHGMGLALCRRIMSQHGGTITAESEIGRGTRIRVAFPADGEAGHGTESQGPADRGRSGLRPDDQLLHR